MSVISSKFDDWKLKVLHRSGEIALLYKDEEKKRFTIDQFLKNGMMLLPKPLHKRIGQEIKLANIYDKFMDKVFDKYDPD